MQSHLVRLKRSFSAPTVRREVKVRSDFSLTFPWDVSHSPRRLLQRSHFSPAAAQDSSPDRLYSWTADLAWGPFNQNKVKLSLREETMKYTTNTSFPPNVLQRGQPEDDDDAT